jgi:hypothetical protein
MEEVGILNMLMHHIQRGSLVGILPGFSTPTQCVSSLWLLLCPAEKLQTRNGTENYMKDKTDTRNYLVS